MAKWEDVAEKRYITFKLPQNFTFSQIRARSKVTCLQLIMCEKIFLVDWYIHNPVVKAIFMKSVKIRMHSSRMHTAPLLTIFRSAQGGLPPGCRPPDADIPLGCRPPLDTDPPDHVTCDACWEATPLVNRMIHRCKNSTLP